MRLKLDESHSHPQVRQVRTARHTCKLVWDCVKKINFVFALAAQGGGSHI